MDSIQNGSVCDEATRYVYVCQTEDEFGDEMKRVERVYDTEDAAREWQRGKYLDFLAANLNARKEDFKWVEYDDSNGIHRWECFWEEAADGWMVYRMPVD